MKSLNLMTLTASVPLLPQASPACGPLAYVANFQVNNQRIKLANVLSRKLVLQIHQPKIRLQNL
jgi:hypothetical protein